MKNLFSYRNILAIVVASAVLLATFGLTSAAAAQSSCGAMYIVQRGDYLIKIARTCNVSYSDLLKANAVITNPSLVYPGRVLNIPVRIQFAAGGTSAIDQGHLAANSKQVYLINIGAGFTLDASLSGPAGLTMAIKGADGSTIQSPSANSTFRGV